jgi:acetylglutamate kinase
MNTGSSNNDSGSDGTPVSYSPEKVNSFKGKIVLIKYGGNAMTDDDIKLGIIEDIVRLKEENIIPVLVHGGGIVIKKLLDDVGIKSEFIGGHRKTDEQAMSYVEMALSGNVNSEIVKMLNNLGVKSVGISGKDAQTVTARKRIHRVIVDGEEQEADLGHVGDVQRIDTGLIETLVENGYVPVISPVAMGDDLKDYNINADMFAGHMAGALHAKAYIAMTNVDGILTDVGDPGSLIRSIQSDDLKSKIGSEIQGGMIPKIESCIIALENGVEEAHIINGTVKHTLLKQLLTDDPPGTVITR